MKKVLIGIGVALVALIVVGAIAGGGKKRTTTTVPPSPAPVVTAAAPAPNATTPAPVKTTAAPSPAAPPPAAPTFKSVFTASGTSDNNTDTFTLTSAPARLVTTTKPCDTCLLAIYLVPQGKSVEKDGGFPLVTIEQGGVNTTNIVDGPGTYYFHITDASAAWTVDVQQKG